MIMRMGGYVVNVREGEFCLALSMVHAVSRRLSNQIAWHLWMA